MQSILILVVFGVFIYYHMYVRRFNITTVYWVSHTLVVTYALYFVFPFSLAYKLLLVGMLYSIFVTYYVFKPYLMQWGNNINITKYHIYLGYVLLPVIGGILLQKRYDEQNKRSD